MTTQTKTPLAEVADLLREVQQENMAPLQRLGDASRPLTERQLSINDKLSDLRIRVDMLRGDGE